MNHPKWIHFGGDETTNADFKDSKIVVLPICYEQGASYGTGSELGPFHLLDASTQLESIDNESLADWSKIPIHTASPLYPSPLPEIAISEIEQHAERFLAPDKFLLGIGGDHAISIGLIKAVSKKYPDIGVLQFDAHMDLRDEWNGSKYNHACVMRRVADDMHLKFVQVGIRAFSKEEAELVKTKNYNTFYSHNIDPTDNSWIEKAISALPELVYFTIDLDGLDPSFMPGTGTPEPDGLSYRQLISLIKALGKARKVIAADINELAVIQGSHVSEFTAAKIAVKVILNLCR